MEAQDQLNKGVVLTSKFTSQSNVFAINTNFVVDPESTSFIQKNVFCKSCLKVGKSIIEERKK